MKRWSAWLLVLALMTAAPALAADGITEFGRRDAAARLVIWGATDLDELRPVLGRFLAQRPDLAITYVDIQTAELYQRLRDRVIEQPDLAISSAADLQIKLVNDGFAREHVPPADSALPQGASWRGQAFGISVEPAVIVYSRDFSRLGTPPRSRQELARMLESDQGALNDRIATYDIAQSGIGYLFASQDSLYSSTFATLAQGLGRARVRLYCCSADILRDIESGAVLVGYNVLGSYALARRRQGAPIEIVLPEDYTLVLSRVAFIPRAARRPDLGGQLLDFLLSAPAQVALPKLADYGDMTRTTAHPIVLNPSLLVFLDSLRRSRFIRGWRALVAPAAN